MKNPTNQAQGVILLIARLSHELQGSFTSKRWLGMGFLNHQQYVIESISEWTPDVMKFLFFQNHGPDAERKNLSATIIKKHIGMYLPNCLGREAIFFAKRSLINQYLAILVGGFIPFEKYSSQVGSSPLSVRGEHKKTYLKPPSSI